MIVEEKIEEGMKFIIRGHYYDDSKKIMLASHDETKLNKTDSYIQTISTYYQTVKLRYGFDRYFHFDKTGEYLPSMNPDDFYYHAKKHLNFFQFRKFKKIMNLMIDTLEEGDVIMVSIEDNIQIVEN